MNPRSEFLGSRRETPGSVVIFFIFLKEALKALTFLRAAAKMKHPAALFQAALKALTGTRAVSNAQPLKAFSYLGAVAL